MFYVVDFRPEDTNVFLKHCSGCYSYNYFSIQRRSGAPADVRWCVADRDGDEKYFRTLAECKAFVLSVG